MPAGETVTVRFDTHHSLNNAGSWQPSLVTEVIAAGLLASVVEGPEYAAHATTRLSQIKQDTLFLQHIQAAILEHFTEQTDA